MCVCAQVLLFDLADLALVWGLTELEYIAECLLANSVDIRPLVTVNNIN